MLHQIPHCYHLQQVGTVGSAVLCQILLLHVQHSLLAIKPARGHVGVAQGSALAIFRNNVLWSPKPINQFVASATNLVFENLQKACVQWSRTCSNYSTCTFFHCDGTLQKHTCMSRQMCMAHECLSSKFWGSQPKIWGLTWENIYFGSNLPILKIFGGSDTAGKGWRSPTVATWLTEPNGMDKE